MSSSIARRTLLRQVRSARLPRSNNVQNLQRGRTGGARYASGGGATEAAKSRLGSDMPWLLGSLIVTVPSTYLILANAPTPSHDDEHGHGDEKSHAKESDDGDDDKEEEKEEDGDKGEGKDEGGDEQKKDSEDDGGDEDGDDDGKDKSKSTEPTSEKKTDGEDKQSGKKKSDDKDSDDEQSDDEKSDEGNGQQEEAKKSDTKANDKKDADSNAKSDDKAKKDEGSSSSGDEKKGEKKDEGSKGKGKLPQHSQEAKQEGLSNTQTSHSTDLSDTSRAPIKSQGGPETAKTKGTVDPKKSGKSSDKM